MKIGSFQDNHPLSKLTQAAATPKQITDLGFSPPEPRETVPSVPLTLPHSSAASGQVAHSTCQASGKHKTRYVPGILL